MKFNFQRHIRLAGTVAALIGLAVNNWPLIIIGWTVVAIGYMITITKIELFIESQHKEEENNGDDNSR